MAGDHGAHGQTVARSAATSLAVRDQLLGPAALRAGGLLDALGQLIEGRGRDLFRLVPGSRVARARGSSGWPWRSLLLAVCTLPAPSATALTKSPAGALASRPLGRQHAAALAPSALHGEAPPGRMRAMRWAVTAKVRPGRRPAAGLVSAHRLQAQQEMRCPGPAASRCPRCAAGCSWRPVPRRPSAIAPFSGAVVGWSIADKSASSLRVVLGRRAPSRSVGTGVSLRARRMASSSSTGRRLSRLSLDDLVEPRAVCRRHPHASTT